MIDLGKIKFTSKYKDGDKVTHELRGDAGLDEMLEAFQRFLRGCGYYFDGTLEIVPEEDHSVCCGQDAFEEAYPDLAASEEPTIRVSIDDATPEEWDTLNRSIMNYAHRTDWQGVAPSNPYNVTYTEHDDKNDK